MMKKIDRKKKTDSNKLSVSGKIIIETAHVLIL